MARQDIACGVYYFCAFSEHSMTMRQTFIASFGFNIKSKIMLNV